MAEQRLVARHKRPSGGSTRPGTGRGGPQIDTVFIAASTSTHAENLRHAADAGDAALCKKPIDLDLGHAVEVVGYATEHNARAMVDP